MHIVAARLGFFLFLIAVAFPALSQSRHALVVGIDRYHHVEPLKKAVNDARAVAEALGKAGFRVDLRTDSDETELLSALSALENRAQQGDEVVVFFAGHGVEVDGQNYLLPADVPVLAAGENLILRRRSIPVADIVEVLARRKVRVSLLILDACRNNPFPRQGTRSLGATRGLAQAEPPIGTFLVYSAGVGQEALDRLSDSDPDPNSVFTRTLLPRLSQPGVDLSTMMRDVRSEVRRLARSVNHEQFPGVYDQLDGAYFFVPPGQTASMETVAKAPSSPCADALPVWSAIQDSDSREALEGFAASYGAVCPALTALAQKRLAAMSKVALLQDPKVAPVQPVVTPAAPTVSPPPVSADPAASDLSPEQMRIRGVALAEGNGVPRDETEAVRWFRAAAEAGNARAMRNIAGMYRQGLGVAQSDAEAARWYRMGAEAGDVPSMSNLGFMYQEGLGVAQSNPDAFRWFRAAAEAGNAKAMNNLGRMYEEGLGVARNDTEAVRWYRAAAEAGEAQGMNNLGVMHEKGLGVARSDTEAVRWYRAAAEAGDALGMSNLGFMYQKGLGVARSDTEAIRWYRAAAEAGDARGMIGLGVMRRDGKGVAQSDSEAFRWFRAAAEAGNARGMANLGEMYAAGRGVARDETEAVRWYRAAAKEGDGHGMYRLGFMYERGQGVGLNYTEALRWFRAAAEARSAAGMSSLGIMYAEGRGVPRNDTDALRWFRAAAEAGSTVGMNGLGRMYAEGRGVKRSDTEAVRWYRAAAEAGNAAGMAALGFKLDSGRGVARNTAQAAMWFLSSERGGSRLFRENVTKLQRETRVEVQRLLKTFSTYTGALDGNFGPASLAALDAYVAKR